MKHITSLIMTICLLLFLFITCTEEPAGPDIDPDLKPHGSITGYIYGIMDKTPLKDVLVSVNADSAQAGVSDGTGKFTVGQVLAGTYTLRFTHREYDNDSSFSVTITTGVDDTLDDTVRLSLASYMIAGRVVFNGAPVPGAGVALAGYPLSTLTGIDGSFFLAKIPKIPGIKLICAKTGIGFCSDSSIQCIPDDTTVISDIKLRGGGATVYGTVYDTSGTPIDSISIVAAVGGGLVDTTDSNGNYLLTNVPTNEHVNIFVPGNKKFYGSTIGFIVSEGSFTKIDIYLRPVVDLVNGNGMALYVNDIIVNEADIIAQIPVFPTVDSATIIETFQWRLSGQLSFRDYETTEPTLSIAIDTLKSLSQNKVIQVSIEAISATDQHSQGQVFKVTIATVKPEATAKGSAAMSGPFTDTVTIGKNEAAYFYGEAYDPFGGIDSVSWDFGDGSAKVYDSTSVAHTYRNVDTCYAVFRVVDIDNNVDSDTVTVIVKEPLLGIPQNITPVNNDTIYTTDTVTLCWHPVKDTEVTYDVYLDSLNFPAETIQLANITDTTACLPVDSGVSYSWKIVAKRGMEKGVGDSWRFSVGESQVNKPPMFTTDSASMTNIATVSDEYQDTVVANDPDGDTLIFSFLDSVSGMSLTSHGDTSIINWTPQVIDTGAHQVSIQVTDNNGGYDTLNWNISVYDTSNNAGARIITEPQSDTVAVGDTGSFIIQAIGTPTLRYTWFKNGTLISGAIENYYTIPSTTLNDNDSRYFCIVENDFGSDTSNEVVLVVLEPPRVTGHPISQSIVIGDSVMFNVSANGSRPFSFQWLENGNTITSATDSSFAFYPDLTDSGSIYKCIVSNYVDKDTSDGAILSVKRNSAPYFISDTSLARNGYIDLNYSTDLDALDPDGHTLRYSFLSSVVGMIIDSLTGQISWTPQTGNEGQHPVTVQVTDRRNGYDTLSWTVYVYDGVIVDDFSNRFGDRPSQNNIAAAREYTQGNINRRSGVWLAYYDKNGSSVESRDGTPIVFTTDSFDSIISDNFDAMVSDNYLQVKLKPVPLPSWAGIACIMYDTTKSPEWQHVDDFFLWNFSNLKAVVLRIKGTGNIRVQITTYDIGSTYVCGWYGCDITLNDTWQTIQIPVSSLEPVPWDPPAQNGWTWDDGKDRVVNLDIAQHDGTEAELYIDEVKLVGLRYEDFGFIYKDP